MDQTLTKPQTNTPTPMPEEESLGRKAWLFFLDTLQTVFFSAVVFAVITIFIARPFQVSGDSMFSTYENKEYILTNLISLRFDDPKRGDVVVFKSPTDGRDFIKRVIAVPGDTVAVKEGFVYVNGEKAEEKYLDEGVKTYGGSFLKEDEEKVLGKDEFLVMGDNRTNSSDSREWGFLPRENIEGISLLVYWPINHFRLIENPFK